MVIEVKNATSHTGTETVPENSTKTVFEGDHSITEDVVWVSKSSVIV